MKRVFKVGKRRGKLNRRKRARTERKKRVQKEDCTRKGSLHVFPPDRF
jgi:hypothetical protein